MNINAMISSLLQNLLYSTPMSPDVLQNKASDAASAAPSQTQLVSSKLTLYIDEAVSEMLNNFTAEIAACQETLRALPAEQQTAINALLEKNGPTPAKVKEGLNAFYDGIKTVAEALNKVAADAAAKGNTSVSSKLQEISAEYEKFCDVNVEKNADHTAVTLVVPLYSGDEKTIYPAHIHIYHEHEHERRAAAECETWIRLTVNTENMGQVNIVVALKDNRLDVKINPGEQFKEMFKKHLPDLENKFDSECITIQDIRIV